MIRKVQMLCNVRAPFSGAHESSRTCAKSLLSRMQRNEATVVSEPACMPITAEQDVRPTGVHRHLFPQLQRL